MLSKASNCRSRLGDCHKEGSCKIAHECKMYIRSLDADRACFKIGTLPCGPFEISACLDLFENMCGASQVQRYRSSVNHTSYEQPHAYHWGSLRVIGIFEGGREGGGKGGA